MLRKVFKVHVPYFFKYRELEGLFNIFLIKVFSVSFRNEFIAKSSQSRLIALASLKRRIAKS